MALSAASPRNSARPAHPGTTTPASTLFPKILRSSSESSQSGKRGPAFTPKSSLAHQAVSSSSLTTQISLATFTEPTTPPIPRPGLTTYWPELLEAANLCLANAEGLRSNCTKPSLPTGLQHQRCHAAQQDKTFFELSASDFGLVSSALSFSISITVSVSVSFSG